MFGDLVEPMKVLISWGKSSYPTTKLGENEKVVVNLYGESVLNKLKKLSNDFFSTDAHKTIIDNDECLKKAEQDFLKKYPMACSQIVKILSWWYLYCFILH